ncbi:hypothetical protein AVEN_122426-1, partial [Araneus ventricosus]
MFRWIKGILVRFSLLGRRPTSWNFGFFVVPIADGDTYMSTNPITTIELHRE